jgi:hypothetical protein
MTENFRHHRASREIVLVPIVIGSPAPLNQAKPPRYPLIRRAPWQPARAILSKARASKRLLDSIIESDAAARKMLRPLPPSAMLAR